MLTFRTSGAWGAGKGEPLTPAEVDTNFYHLASQLAGAGGGNAVTVTGITMNGGSLTFILSNGTTRGPFPTPDGTNTWRGRWQPNTLYSELDLIFHPSLGGYQVQQPHTSRATFDPARRIGGQPVYLRLFALLPGGFVPVRQRTQSSYTLQAEDANAFLRMLSGANVTLTVPDDTTLSFPLGTEVVIRASGNGLVTFQGGATGVALNLPGGRDTIALTGGVAHLKKVGANEWDVWFDDPTPLEVTT